MSRLPQRCSASWHRGTAVGFSGIKLRAPQIFSDIHAQQQRQAAQARGAAAATAVQRPPGFIAGAVSYVIFAALGFAMDFATTHGLPFLGPSEIMVDKEERKALANDYAKDQSVGGHRAQDLIKEIHKKDLEESETSSADDTAHAGQVNKV